MPKPIRLLLLERLKANFIAAKKGQPTDDPYLFGFSTVEIGPLREEDSRKVTAVGIVAGPEDIQHEFPGIVEKKMKCSIEWRITRNQKDPDPGILAELMLCEVQRVVLSDLDLGGLCIDIMEIGNQVDMDTYADRSIYGVVECTILYRHRLQDPRSDQPGFDE